MEASTVDIPQQQQRQQQEPPSMVVGRGGSDAKNEIVFQVEVNETTTFFHQTLFLYWCSIEFRDTVSLVGIFDPS
jgi:hypothetical protein